VRGISILALFAAGCGAHEETPAALVPGSAAGASIVLITLDTTRADRLGAYGYSRAETPTLDRLAREGARFDDAVSPAPMTLPAHASILTGLDPDHHGARHNGLYRLDESKRTLAEILSENGYETAAFVSGFVLDARYGLAQGFETYDDRIDPLPGQPFGGLGERSAQAVTDSALAWLEGRRGRQPFFLWVHYYDPHAEYRPPEDFARRFEDPYDGEIAFMDSQIRRLVEAIEREKGKLLVVVAGDHGESFGEHSEFGHSKLLYETTQRVPLFLWSKDVIPRPFVVDDVVVGLVDVFPTILDLAGIDDGGATDGKSLRIALEEGDRNRSLYMETLAPYLDNGWAPLHALRRHHDKYVLAPKEEYYALRRDPRESENLYRHGNGAADLAGRMRERLKDASSPEAIAAGASRVDSESLRQLQALGYLTGPGPASASESELPDPKDMMPIQRLVIESRTLRRELRPEEALPKAREALRAAPKDLEVLEEMGLVFIELERLDDAEKTFRRLNELKANPNVNVLLAQILAETGRRDEGKELLRKAMELEPGHGGVLVTWGDFLAEEGKYAEALASYEKAKEVDPYRATAVADRRIVELRRRASGS
jgi:arylsulfatase A-like enzyme